MSQIVPTVMKYNQMLHNVTTNCPYSHKMTPNLCTVTKCQLMSPLSLNVTKCCQVSPSFAASYKHFRILGHLVMLFIDWITLSAEIWSDMAHGCFEIVRYALLYCMWWCHGLVTSWCDAVMVWWRHGVVDVMAWWRHGMVTSRCSGRHGVLTAWRDEWWRHVCCLGAGQRRSRRIRGTMRRSFSSATSRTLKKSE